MSTFTLILVSSALCTALVQLIVLRRSQDRLRRLSYEDPLTGLPNRRAWDHATDALIDRGHAFAFVLFDMANLKAANTALGHVGADNLIRRAEEATRGGEPFYRVGGDEFALLLPGDGCDVDVAHAEAARMRIERQFGTTHVASRAPVFLAGAAGSWKPGEDFAGACVETDAALDQHKLARKSALGAHLNREDALAGMVAAA
tara:strand:- start:4808 stop:5413 length:606 start_codon:yes stop_codon:yes gene_type:complete